MISRMNHRVVCRNPVIAVAFALLLLRQSRQLSVETEDLMGQLKSELDTAQLQLNKQEAELDELTRNRAELEDTVTVLQRSVVSLTQDSEGARAVLQAGIEDSKRRIQTSTKISGVLSGIEDVFAE